MGMSFSDVVQNIRFAKAKLCRSGWNGKGMYIELQEPTPQSKMTRPYIFMKTVDGDLVPWVASQSDLLADDWAFYYEGE